MLQKRFKQLAMGTAALALSSAFTTTAIAGKDFIKLDCRAETTTTCVLAGEELSADKLTFVVHGGNRNLMMAAYRVAQRLDDENIPIAFLLAPNRDKLDIRMHVDFYTKGGTQFGLTAYDNDKNTIQQIETGLYEQAIKAYNKGFPKTASNPQTKNVAAARALSNAFTAPALAGNITYDKRFEKNCQSHTTNFCQVVAQKLSNRENWLPIVAHGGNENLYNAVRRTAIRLNQEGIRAYIIRAPDRDIVDSRIHVDFYTKGGTQFGLTAYDNDNITIKQTEADLYEQAKKAYDSGYGKTIRSQPIDQTVTLNNN